MEIGQNYALDSNKFQVEKQYKCVFVWSFVIQSFVSFIYPSIIWVQGIAILYSDSDEGSYFCLNDDVDDVERWCCQWCTWLNSFTYTAMFQLNFGNFVVGKLEEWRSEGGATKYSFFAKFYDLDVIWNWVKVGVCDALHFHLFRQLINNWQAGH